MNHGSVLAFIFESVFSQSYFKGTRLERFSWGKEEKKWKQHTPFRFLSRAETLKKHQKMLTFNLEYAFYFQEEFGCTEWQNDTYQL